jgi:hypothetical protein
MKSFLPMLLGCLPDVHTIENSINAYHVACLRLDWTGADVVEKQTHAVNTIRARAFALARRLDVIPEEHARQAAEIGTLRRELKEARAQIAALTDAQMMRRP